MSNIQKFMYTEGGGYSQQPVTNPIDIEFLIIDLFCGAGGTTTGFDRAQLNGKKCALVIACINHDAKAIKSHWLNHPEVVHFEEDIRTLELSPLVELLIKYRLLYPNSKVILWASLECTNFSKAKGGQPRDADSRTLAEHLERYIIALNPDYVQIENVVEFMSWGPLDERGKPVSRKSGSDWLRWRKEICNFGYRDEWQELNSANFGAYTSRNRLFGCFAKPGLPIVWPESTHAKKPVDGGMFGNQQKWKAVKDVLDFEDEGLSIFNRKKPLVDASLERIEAGLIKFVAGGKDSFLLQYNSGSKDNRVIDVDKPCNTIPTSNRFALAQTHFLAKYYGNGNNVSSIEEPAGTLVTKDRYSKIQTVFFDKTFTGNSNIQSIDNPAGTIMPNDKHRLINCQPFILNPSHGGHTMSTDVPCPVIIARQDKAPLYLIQLSLDINVSIPVYDDDSAVMIRIKQFMALYGIADIKMRMLKVSELLPIQGFPIDYQLSGNQTDQKKFIGNSVVPHVVTCWCEAMAGKTLELRQAS